MLDFVKTAVVVVFGVVVVMVFVLVGMFVMMMGVKVFVLFFAVDGDGEMCAANSAFFGRLEGISDRGNSERIKPFGEALRFGQKLHQRRREHIPRRTHRTFKIKRFHSKVLSLKMSV